MFSIFPTYDEYRNRAKECSPTRTSFEEFKKVVEEFERFTCARNTIFGEALYLLRENIKEKDLQDAIEYSKQTYILDYNDEKARRNIDNEFIWHYSTIYWWLKEVIIGEIVGRLNYEDLKLFYDISKRLNLYLVTYDELIDESYLEALRIKEENRGIKLTRDQRNVLDSIDRGCRWLHVPTEETDKVLALLGISQELKESEITDIIASVQEKNEVVVSTFMGHTVLMGLQLPYALYADGSAYEANEGQHGEYLNKTLSLLSKEFGSAEYFEYNEDDSQIVSLSLSKKGKLVYACFSSEGEGKEIFGTRKKSMEVNRATVLKTSGRLGITPEDHFTLVMKQKQKVRHFTQPNWAIESMMKRYGGEAPIGDN